MALFGKKRTANNRPGTKPLPTMTIPAEGSEEVILVGTEYYPRGVAQLPKRGDFQIQLIREPQTQYSEKPIAARFKGELVGYLSEAQAAKYAPVMDAIGHSFDVHSKRRDGHEFVLLPKALELARHFGPPTAHLIRDLEPRPSFFLKGGKTFTGQIEQLLEESTDFEHTATITSEVIKSGKWEGQTKYFFWVGERCLGEAAPRFLEGNEWLFAVLGTGRSQMPVSTGRHVEYGPWARVTKE